MGRLWSMRDRSTKQRHGATPLAARQRGLLIADDNPNMRELLEATLKSLNTPITVVEDGLMALEILSQPQGPEVLVVDHDMPKLSGSELCKRVRASAGLSPVYIIMLSGNADINTVSSLGFGADEYLTKPFDPRELRACVRQALRTQALRRVLARRERRRAIEWLGMVMAHEINNPLAAALANLEHIQSLAAEHPEGQEVSTVAAETIAALERLRASGERLQKRDNLQSGGKRTLRPNELVAIIQKATAPFAQSMEIAVNNAGAEHACFDVELLTSAVVALLQKSLEYCVGLPSMTIHISQCKMAVLLEVGGAPEIDPEHILSPQLCSPEDGGPPRYDAGLANLEADFERFGGQIFARPKDLGWRFGLTLPLSEPSDDC